VPLDATALGLLEKYLALLNKWNEKINLTAVRKEREQVVSLLLDSLAVAMVVPDREKVLDVGSGAGLPGIPLKVARPGIDLTLAESRRKKADFLGAVARELGLRGVRVHPGRAEELAAGEKFGMVTARAVAELGELAALAGGLLGPGGRLVAMKGPDPEAELRAAQGALDRAGLRLDRVRRYELPAGGGSRSLVILVKA
jgi:16S rRNA (guanine527-N7)-methyltransferase